MTMKKKEEIVTAETDVVCGACLSRGRRVSPLGAARAARVLRASAEVSGGARPDTAAELGPVSRLPMCWECRAHVEQTITFCDRVRRAQVILTSEHLVVLTDSDNNASMSTLGRKIKVGFDYEFYQEVDPNVTHSNEISSLESNGSIIDANGITSFVPNDVTVPNEIVTDSWSMEKSSVKLNNDNNNFRLPSTNPDEVNTQDTNAFKAISIDNCSDDCNKKLPQDKISLKNNSMDINPSNNADRDAINSEVNSQDLNQIIFHASKSSSSKDLNTSPSNDRTCNDIVKEDAILFENSIMDIDPIINVGTDATHSEVTSKDLDQLNLQTSNSSNKKDQNRSPSKDRICNDIIEDGIFFEVNIIDINESNDACTSPSKNVINCAKISQDSDKLKSYAKEIISIEDQDSDSSGQSDPSWDVALSPLNTSPAIVQEKAFDHSTEPKKKEDIDKGTESVLETSHVVVMKDLTKNLQKKVMPYKTVRIEEPIVTIKSVKGGNVKEANLLDFKVNTFLKNFKIPKLPSVDKHNHTSDNLVESQVKIKMTPALEYVPLRSGRVSTTFMNEAEMLESREDDRNAEHYVKSLFKCETCIVGFNNGAFLEEHNNSKHSPELGAHVCDICKMRLPTALNVRNHRRTHYHLYVCSACGYTQRQLADVNRHYADVHEADRSFPCSQCGQLFLKFRQLRYHREKAHKKPKQCPHCDKSFNCGATYKRHLELHTGMPVYDCAICGKSCRGKALLDAHMRTHEAGGGEGAYCAECDVHFKSKYIYRQHLRTSRKHIDHDQMKHICDSCDKRFTSPGELRIHNDVVHLHKELFKCEPCDKNYVSAHGLKLHVQAVHEGVRPTKDKFCDICEKGFSSNRILATHRRTHTGERPHTCTHCGATFRQSGALYKHVVLVHGGASGRRETII